MNALSQIETPALILDLPKVRANCARMSERLAEHGVALRPHVKTAKTAEVIRIALDGKTGPITVSTLAEADRFFAEGFTDILYAIGIVPGKFARAAALVKKGCNLKVILDTAEAATALRDFCAREGLKIPALIEIDTDDHRAGVPPEAGRLIEIGTILHAAGLLGGVMTHAGNSYESRTEDDIRRWARMEREGITRAAGRLRAAGCAVPIVSLGSTPTALFGESFEGVTEVRAGVYVFFDLVMAGLGVCGKEDIALSVAASVIGHQEDKGWVVTDSGWTALSRDRGTQKQAVDQGYGVVCDADGNVLEDLTVVSVFQEHGIVAARDGGKLSPADFPVGRVLRILPNHACAMGAQHAGYIVLDGDKTQRWERINGW
jgi:D-serine deaminase-like pyridoxal phosphate-dependent protein